MQYRLKGGLNVEPFERSSSVCAVEQFLEAILVYHCRSGHLFRPIWMQMDRVGFFRRLRLASVQQAHFFAAAAEEKPDRGLTIEGSWGGPVDP